MCLVIGSVIIYTQSVRFGNVATFFFSPETSLGYLRGDNFQFPICVLYSLYPHKGFSGITHLLEIGWFCQIQLQQILTVFCHPSLNQCPSNNTLEG